jgi:hypothetical protein
MPHPAPAGYRWPLVQELNRGADGRNTCRCENTAHLGVHYQFRTNSVRQINAFQLSCIDSAQIDTLPPEPVAIQARAFIT